MAIKINKLNNENQNYLAFTYPGQCRAQPCYIELDCEDHTLQSDYSSEIGNGLPGYVWHNRAIRFSIPALTADAANDLMQEISDRCQKILDGYDCVWNGSNHVGTYSDAAQKIIDSLHYEMDNLYTDEDNLAQEKTDEE
jgi:hypothetical protein